jgi:hypothetical protein
MAQTHDSFSIDAEASGGDPDATIREHGRFSSRLGREGSTREVNDPPRELCRTPQGKQQAQAVSSALFHTIRETFSDLVGSAASSLDSAPEQ